MKKKRKIRLLIKASNISGMIFWGLNALFSYIITFLKRSLTKYICSFTIIVSFIFMIIRKEFQYPFLKTYAFFQVFIAFFATFLFAIFELLLTDLINYIFFISSFLIVVVRFMYHLISHLDLFITFYFSLTNKIKSI